MVHADASNFRVGITKEDAYKQVLEQAEALYEGQRNWVCNLANTASLLYHAYLSLPTPSSSVNWAGFYVLHKPSSSPPPLVSSLTGPPAATTTSTATSPATHLILGPFMGKVACQTIAVGKGVCGTVAASGKSEVVRDVEAWPEHIACDGDSRSEIVVPILVGEKVVAVIDVDCKDLDGFDGVDRMWLEKLAELLAGSCDW